MGLLEGPIAVREAKVGQANLGLRRGVLGVRKGSVLRYMERPKHRSYVVVLKIPSRSPYGADCGITWRI